VSAHRGCFPGGSGVAVNLFRTLGWPVVAGAFYLVEALFALQLGLTGNRRPKTDVVSDFYGYGHVLDNQIQRLRATGMLEVRNGEIAGYKGKTLELKSGDVLEADLVVFGTGFRQDYSIFPHDLREKLEIEQDGLYLYRYILPSKIDNLAFVGKVAAVSNISSYGLQAEWLARKIVTQTLPSQEERAAEIAVRKQWARSWMPETAGRGSLVLLHQTHYHDQLLRDIGERPLRKGNLLSEYLMPYVSQDYNGILGMPLK